jgi:DNA invertase Pin-like site-specific DNA recombinase
VGCKLVAYRRVSTQKQGQSGLGLEAQDAAIRAYQQATGCTIVRQFKEVETGKEDQMENRPELLKAIALAKRTGATLVIAKLDRLARSVFVTATLHKAEIDFVCCDNPTANKLTIQILAAIAENEAKATSQRTKDALKAYREGRRVSKRIRALYPNGVPADVIEATAGKLGASLPQCRNLTDKARQLGVKAASESHRQKADEFYAGLVDHIQELKATMSLHQVAVRLNEEGEVTRRGKLWNHAQVKRVLARSKAQN